MAERKTVGSAGRVKGTKQSHHERAPGAWIPTGRYRPVERRLPTLEDYDRRAA